MVPSIQYLMNGVCSSLWSPMSCHDSEERIRCSSTRPWAPLRSKVSTFHRCCGDCLKGRVQRTDVALLPGDFGCRKVLWSRGWKCRMAVCHPHLEIVRVGASQLLLQIFNEIVGDGREGGSSLVFTPRLSDMDLGEYQNCRGGIEGPGIL